jgi:threonine dehydrogenase-like Zn-dependent dehydrogenase
MADLPRVTLAAVTAGRRQTQLRELDIPVIGPDAGLLKVEAAGVCGADVRSYDRDLPPRVMGHEVVGRIAAAGVAAARRWGVAVGDRVALEEYLPCGNCRFCRSSEFRLCLKSDPSVTPGALRYGTTPLSAPPGLWGGYSQYMYLHPSSVLHRVAPGVPAVQASLALPLGNGYQWAYLEGGAGPGKTVVVMGPGQQGLGCVLAAREAGSERIIVTGLRRDAERLEVAKMLGAHHTICAQDSDVAGQVADLTGGEMADAVVDAAAGNETTIPMALAMLKKRGVLVAAAASASPLTAFDLGAVTKKCLTVKGVRGHSYESVEWALRLIASQRYPLDRLCSIECSLGEVHRAITGTAGELDIPVIHAAVVPDGAVSDGTALR